MANSVLGGKLAFVTGAGSGIGRAVCQVLAREGAKVIATDKDEKSAQKTLSLLKSLSATSQHLHLPLDVSRSEEVYSVVKSAIEHFSVPPTIVVNCAGITRDNFLLKLDEDSFQQVIDVNLKRKYDSDYIKFGFTAIEVIKEVRPQCVICTMVLINEALKPAKLERHLKTVHHNLSDQLTENIAGKLENLKKMKRDKTGQRHELSEKALAASFEGTFLVTQTIARALVEANITGGSIINLASIVGRTGNIGQCSYAASKAAIEAFTKTTAKELGTFGIRCNAVVPGFIHTPMTDAVPDKVKEKFRANIALRRFGKAEEVAEVIAFLASDKSSYVNGASIEVIGG
uniref:Estradiol 17-beta-dehydrogenase 8 n=1 Tax=Timema poppense TaxID=170557 RepID=A0A7R9CZ37_TIMPO|nr:unnamed protein product [Timema poppensis]